jgi:leucyl aminopeptidase
MQVTVSPGSARTLHSGALVVPVFSDGKLDGAAEVADKELGGALADVLAAKEITGAANDVALLRGPGLGTKRVLAVGLGDRAKFEPSALVKYAGTAIRYLGKRNVHDIAIALPLEAQHHSHDAAGFIVEGALAGTIDTTTYRTEPDKPIVIEALTIVGTAGSHEFDRSALEAGANHGRILGEAINFARTLALTPANDMTPTHLAKAAQTIAKENGLEFHSLDEAEMERKGMGSILGVSRGSDEPAAMIVLRYNGDPGSKETLGLVGKGLTFDSGGISIKPAENMHEMKYDMSGGAGVIAALGAIAQLKLKLNVIGVVPASENLPGHRAMKPGDILRAMNGKTIEVINTDAEGRLILADALCYVRELGATKIVDAATLTGAIVISLGHAASGTIGNDEAFTKHFLSVAKNTAERYWELPLYDEYAQAVKSEIADLRNSTGRPAGSLTAAAFLRNFVDKTPWIHLDIAGTAYLDSESAYQAKGPTGTPVRAFVALAEDLARGAAHATNGAAQAAAVKQAR